MSLIVTILLSFISNAFVGSLTYYVSNAGNDNNDGLTQATAWKTLNKINTYTFLQGDSILLKSGDTWNEKLIIPSSGAAGHQIVVSNYGSGNQPLVTGFTDVTGFTNSGNIWSATVAASKTLNTVTIGGVLRAKGRYPNNDYLLTANGGTQTTLNTFLSGTPSYVGAEVAVKELHFVIDVSKVSAQSTSTLTLSNPLTYSGYSTGYFFQNTVAVLDTLNEWAYDGTTLSVYANSLPVVQASNIDTLVYFSNKSYIKFSNLSFSGANKAAVEIDNSNNITFDNCTFTNIGGNAIGGTQIKNVSITNNTLKNIQSCGVRFDPDTLTNIGYNYFKNIGHLDGMGGNGNGTYNAIYQLGPKPTITNNILDSVGYLPINFKGISGLIEYNYATNYCFVKDDGGGIYSYIGTSSPLSVDTGTIVRKNIVVNGIGAPKGTGSTNRYAQGFYMDTYVNGVLLDSNTSINATEAGYFSHGGNNLTFRGNTAYSTNSHSYVIEIYQGAFCKLFSNISYNANSSWKSLVYANTNGLEALDSNAFMRPALEAGKITFNNTNYGADFATTGFNVHGSETPPNISNIPIIIYNPTMTDSTVNIGGNYINVKGQLFSNYATLKPFASEILYLSNSVAAQIIKSRSKFRLLKL